MSELDDGVRSDATAPPAQPLPEALLLAVDAARQRKADDLEVLDLRGLVAFTDYFVVMTGGNIRQIQAIVDAVQEQLKAAGHRAAHVEGYNLGEWVLLDYSDFVVHVFAAEKRALYDLERLWSDAARVSLPRDGAAA